MDEPLKLVNRTGNLVKLGDFMGSPALMKEIRLAYNQSSEKERREFVSSVTASVPFKRRKRKSSSAISPSASAAKTLSQAVDAEDFVHADRLVQEGESRPRDVAQASNADNAAVRPVLLALEDLSAADLDRRIATIRRAVIFLALTFLVDTSQMDKVACFQTVAQASQWSASTIKNYYYNGTSLFRFLQRAGWATLLYFHSNSLYLFGYASSKRFHGLDSVHGVDDCSKAGWVLALIKDKIEGYSGREIIRADAESSLIAAAILTRDSVQVESPTTLSTPLAPRGVTTGLLGLERNDENAALSDMLNLPASFDAMDGAFGDDSSGFEAFGMWSVPAQPDFTAFH